MPKPHSEMDTSPIRFRLQILIGYMENGWIVWYVDISPVLGIYIKKERKVLLITCTWIRNTPVSFFFFIWVATYYADRCFVFAEIQFCILKIKWSLSMPVSIYCVHATAVRKKGHTALNTAPNRKPSTIIIIIILSGLSTEVRLVTSRNEPSSFIRPSKLCTLLWQIIC